MKRAGVFELISQERDYHEVRRPRGTIPNGGYYEVGSWLTFMQDYLTEAIHQISRSEDSESIQRALETIRKITGMGVACMEQHETPARKPL